MWIWPIFSPRTDQTKPYYTPNPNKHHGTPYPNFSSQLKHTYKLETQKQEEKSKITRTKKP